MPSSNLPMRDLAAIGEDPLTRIQDGVAAGTRRRDRHLVDLSRSPNREAASALW